MRTTPHYNLAQSLNEEDKNYMLANEQQEEEEKEETSTVGRRTIRRKRRIENIETFNIFDCDKVEAQMINNDDTFSEVSSFNNEVYYRSGMVRLKNCLYYLLINIMICQKTKTFSRKTNSKHGYV